MNFSLPTQRRPKSLSYVLQRWNAFTLLELILVMALLTIVFGLALPALQGFFRGRNLDSEARRFLHLTRYAQNRAASEGFPMIVWMDTAEGAYGMQAAASYVAQDPNAVAFKMQEALQLRVVERSSSATGGSSMVLGAGTRPKTTVLGGRPSIRFAPDGYVDPQSPILIQMQEHEDERVLIIQKANRTGYEIIREEHLLERLR